MSNTKTNKKADRVILVSLLGKYMFQALTPATAKHFYVQVIYVPFIGRGPSPPWWEKLYRPLWQWNKTNKEIHYTTRIPQIWAPGQGMESVEFACSPCV